MWKTWSLTRIIALLGVVIVASELTSATIHWRLLSPEMIYTQLPSNLEEVDVIVAGGGTAACVLASRLAKADPTLSILVIERGPNNYNVSSIIHPALYRSTLRPTSGYSLLYIGKPEEQLANRSIPILTGGVLGGGSSVNGAIYGRGQRVDYDSWNTEGWSADDLVPFLKQLETYYPAEHSSVHGSDGPTGISSGTYDSESLKNDFIAAANLVGYEKVPDTQDLVQGNAVSPAYQYVSPTTGKRQDAAHTYLHPQLEAGSGNLHVLIQSQVIRVLLDQEQRASGVEFRNNGSTSSVKARKLVVVSSGAMGTPQILERSGIGSAEVLAEAGVDVAVDIPGVGHDYQDHQMVVVIYNSTLAVEDSVDSVINGALNATELLETDAKILSWNGINAYAKLRPSQSEIDNFEPSLRRLWDRDYANEPNKPFGIIIPMAGILGGLALPSGSYVSLACYNPYPYSRGSLHIKGAGIDDPPDFRTGYFTDPDEADVQIIAWLYKKQRQIARRMRTRQDQVSPAPLYSESSRALDDFALDFDSSDDVTYSAADEEAIRIWARANVGTAYHPMGTSKMAPKERLGVVDASLSVYGTKGLKVADLSIAPEMVSGNTMNAALLVGEKAADIIIKELSTAELQQV